MISGLSQDIKCPVCQKTVPSDEAEIHLVMCLTRPKITYNGWFLNRFLFLLKGTCEDVVLGDALSNC